MKPTPLDIKSTGGTIRIVWSDGHQSVYDARDLRMACRCAACVDEWTHESLVKPDRIPMDIRPRAMNVMGNYALHIDWSDGHNTGIYSYDHLREVCACDECKKDRSFIV